ncbi:MAG: hypothetical protein ABJ308_10815 [Halieaceae bacterium]
MEKYDITFRGETLPGHDLEAIKQRFAVMFRIDDPERVDAFFGGRKVILRRNLNKKRAAHLFAALRQIGVVSKIEKVSTEEVVLSSEPKPVKSTAAPRKRRQPGAPNLFELRLSERAGVELDGSERASHLVRGPIIAAAIMLLAFMLVGLRFWAESRAAPDMGLGKLAIDARQQPVVEVNDQLLLHDRAGIATESLALANFGANAGARFDFFGTGELLILRREPPPVAPEWLHPLLGIEPAAGAILSRCTLTPPSCTDLLSELGDVEFSVERRTDTIYLADASHDRLEKRAADGTLIASKAMELTAPLSLIFQEGILYLTQGGSDTVRVLKPDDNDFGQQLDSISLQVEDASQSGHIYPASLAWLNQQWWTVMQSRDGSTAGLYLFGARWKFQQAVQLPVTARPDRVVRWSNKILAVDHQAESIYRFDAAARTEKAFSSASIESALGERQSRLSLSRSLQVAILMVLFIAASALLALGTLQSLRQKVYMPKSELDEAGFDINDEAIEWLDPAPDTEQRLRKVGYAIAGSATLLLIVGFFAQWSIWWMIALSLLLAGLGGYYFALQRVLHSHVGLLDDQLIVVDHRNTYRVGRDAKIQYLSNFIMIDDVIVYLGNPLVHQFAAEHLQETFEPVVTRGIKVDRATLQVKLIQSRHPLLLGVSGLTLAAGIALLLILLPS